MLPFKKYISVVVQFILIMEYRQIVAVTGLSGLFQLLSTKNDGAIVRSLNDKSVKFVSARIHHITPLESIEIYTTGENVRLHEVLEKIKEDDSEIAKLNSKKDDKAAKAFFKTVLPDFDEDRVYTSDIRKILKWYDVLKANDLLQFDYLKEAVAEQEDTVNEVSANQDNNADQDKPVAAEVTEEPKPKAKKAVAKKTIDEDKATEEKPAKKAAAKKKAATEVDGEKPVKKAAPKKKKEEKE